MRYRWFENSTGIDKAVRDGTVVLRLWDDESISQLEHAGFLASDRSSTGAHAIRCMRPELLGKHVVCPHISDTIAEHVTRGWAEDPRYASSFSFFFPLASPWISATADFEWAVFEISRRLTMTRVQTVVMSPILLPARKRKYSSAYRGIRTTSIKACDVLEAYVRSSAYIQDEETVYRAINFANAASEVLFYGCIPRRHVVTHSAWTITDVGMAIPEYMWVSPNNPRYDEDDWTDRLVWDPRRDTYRQAAAKMRNREKQLR